MSFFTGAAASAATPSTSPFEPDGLRPCLRRGDLLAQLRQHPVLAAAHAASLARLAERAQVRAYDAGSPVLRAGLSGQSVYFLIQGRVSLYARMRKDRKMLCGLLDAPAVFGDDLMLGGPMHLSTSATAEGEVLAILVPTELLAELVERDAHLAKALYREACIRHARIGAILQFMALEPTEDQLLRLLTDLADGTTQVDRSVDLCQSGLARALAVDRKTIARNLKRLVAQGSLRVSMGKAILPAGAAPASLVSWRISCGVEGAQS